MEECGQAETELPRAAHMQPLSFVLKTESKNDLCLLSLCPPDSMGWVKGRGRPGLGPCSVAQEMEFLHTWEKEEITSANFSNRRRGAGRHLYGTFLSESFFFYFFFHCKDFLFVILYILCKQYIGFSYRLLVENNCPFKK
jgi:hypothetical protein